MCWTVVLQKNPQQHRWNTVKLPLITTLPDPVLFIKDSANGIIRVSNLGPEANNGQIIINAGDGLEASGDNATANQLDDTIRVISAKADVGYGIGATPTGLRLEGSWSKIPLLPV